MKRLFVLGAALFAASAANAEGPGYSYIQASYQDVSASGGIDGDGFKLAGSYGFNENWYGLLSYETSDFDFGIELNQLEAGVGYHVEISETTDFFGDVSYVDLEADLSGFGSDSESGYRARIGLRSMVTPKLELAAAVSQLDVVDGLDGTFIGGAAWYSFTDTFAVGINAEFEDELDKIGAGVRFYFK